MEEQDEDLEFVTPNTSIDEELRPRSTSHDISSDTPIKRYDSRKFRHSDGDLPSGFRAVEVFQLDECMSESPSPTNTRGQPFGTSLPMPSGSFTEPRRGKTLKDSLDTCDDEDDNYLYPESPVRLETSPIGKFESMTTPTTMSIRIPQTEPAKALHQKKDFNKHGTALQFNSVSPIKDRNARYYAKREDMLDEVKHACDIELRLFFDFLSQQIETLNYPTHSQFSNNQILILQKLKKFAEEMMELNTEDIKEGKCKVIVDQVVNVQQYCFKMKMPRICSSSSTKLLLIISRVSRLVEHLDLYSSNATQQSSSYDPREFHQAFKLQDSAEQPSSSDSQLQALHTKQRSHEDVIKVSETKAEEKSSPFDGAAIFTFLVEKVKQFPWSFVRKSQDEIPPPKEEKDVPLELLCRICEELVPSDLLEEHSKVCAMETRNELKANDVDERILKFIKALERRMEEQTLENKSTKTVLGPADIEILEQMKQVLACAMKANLVEDGANNIIIEQISYISKITSNSYLQQTASSKAAEELLKVFGERIVGVLKMKLSLYYETNNQGRQMYRSNSLMKVNGDKKPSLKDFQIIKPISKGAFGKVFLAKKKTTGDVYAIKVMNKNDLRNKNQAAHIRAERHILAHTQHPFLVKFYYSFQTKENLYMVMEYLNGGDLYSLLKNWGSFDERMTRQFLAEVVLALEYLHSMGIIHRDLKPDNMLVGHDGHIKLTDFGLSKFAVYNVLYNNDYQTMSGDVFLSPFGSPPQPPFRSPFGSPTHSPPYSPPSSPHASLSTSPTHRKEDKRRYSLVGTPDYLAPEVILGTGHDKEVDWWALGAIMFEFLTGIPPFNAESSTQIFENILNRDIPWPEVPEEMSQEAFDCIDHLLSINVEERLGFRGAQQVKNHVFFAGIKWDTLLEQEPVFVPKIKDNLDTSYFDESKSKFEFESDEESSGEDQDDFLNFSYQHLPNLAALTKNLMKNESPNVSRRTS